MTELSVIIPYVNEWPQILFTIRSIAETLRGEGIDFEIIAVDNWCEEVEEQNRVADRGHDRMIDPDVKDSSYGLYKPGPPGVTLQLAKSHIYAMAKKHEWLKYIRYEDKLSHWNAKNVGVKASKGDFLWFMDSHVVLGKNASGMFKYYENEHKSLNGTMHLPWTYHILESQRQIYKLVTDPEKAIYHYSTLKYSTGGAGVFEVPAMTTCGMLMSREIFDRLGGWPTELGIYGGGENFVNFSCAVMGLKKWVWPYSTIYHHGDRRGYNWNYDDYHRNRTIAVFMHSGRDAAHRYIRHNFKGSSPRKLTIDFQETSLILEDHRKKIRDQTVISLDSWVAGWQESSPKFCKK
jgi:glycosyltransferase involved in cell wall biosynthesis